MWPLLGISIVALAVLIERFLYYAQCRFPSKGFAAVVEQSLATGSIAPLEKALSTVPALRNFTHILATPHHPHREAALQAAGEGVLRSLEQRLPLLRVLGQIAPLLGLLGTVLGMIATFSRIASAPSGVDMGMLADGIWQALITTATGISIAIPIVLCLSLLQNRVRRVRSALADAGNTALLLWKDADGTQAS